MTPKAPQVLRLRTIELLALNRELTPETTIAAKRNGIDCWVHEVHWADDAKRTSQIARARQHSRNDFKFALCLVISGNAVTTTSRINDLMNAFRDPNCLTINTRPVVFVRDEERSTDLLGFIQPVREAARIAGLREPRICRVISHGELEGTGHANGFDDIVELDSQCSCHGTERLQRDATHSRAQRCVVVGEAKLHSNAVAREIAGAIDAAMSQNIEQTSIYVHNCSDWSPEQLAAQDEGVLRGMKHMPSFPSIGAPYESPTAYRERPDRPALTVALVTQSNPEALMVCLQSILDTSSDIGSLEFLVLDNGSTDETQALLSALSGDVTSIRNETATSTKDAWNKVLSMSNGELVLLISSDVVLGHGWHQPLMQALSVDPSCNAVTPAIAVGTNYMPTQPPAVNSGVCILARGNAARNGTLGDARFVDESVVFLRLETPEVTK